MSEGQDYEPLKVPAIGYSIVGSISDNAQITFQHFVDAGETDQSVNEKLDRIMTFIDRQRAKYEIPSLKKELLDLTDKLAQVDEDMANSEANFQKAQADHDVQIETLQKQHKTAFEQAYAKHRASGRGGEFKPKGAVEQELGRYAAGVEQLTAAKQRNVNEREQFLQNIGANKQRMQIRAAVVQERIALLEAQVT